MGSRLRLAAGLIASAILLCSSPAASRTGADFGRAVDRTIDRVIVPGYATLAAEAGALVRSIETLRAQWDNHLAATIHSGPAGSAG